MEEYRKLSIKEWAIEDRPREKMLSKGIKSLTDAELLSILIGSGTRNDSALELAKKVMASVNHNLNELCKKSADDLKQVKGIGKARAVSIIAALELGKRRKLSAIIDRKKISSSGDVAEIFQPDLGDLHYEEFWILLLNRANKIIDRQKISSGGITGTVIDVRIILKIAVEKLATSLILCHNHPSGNLVPSEADVEITRKLKDAAKIMDISILDHVIVNDNAYYSFADEGIM
ncbi:MAG: DNA repair protein RadC [Bacteroidia bacterium]|nr:DNA repair protein RadC [Bacteroidia bacterium]